MALHVSTTVAVHVDGKVFQEPSEIVCSSSRVIRDEVVRQTSNATNRTPFLHFLSKPEECPATVHITNTTIDTWKYYIDFLKQAMDSSDDRPVPSNAGCTTPEQNIDMVFLALQLDDEAFMEFAKSSLMLHASKPCNLIDSILSKFINAGFGNITNTHNAQMKDIVTQCVKEDGKKYVDRMTSILTQARDCARERAHEAEAELRIMHGQLENDSRLVRALKEASTIAEHRGALDRLTELSQTQVDTIRDLREQLESGALEHVQDLKVMKQRLDEQELNTSAAQHKAEKYRKALGQLKAKLNTLLCDLDPNYTVSETPSDSRSHSRATNSPMPSPIDDQIEAAGSFGTPSPSHSTEHVSASPVASPGGESVSLTTVKSESVASSSAALQNESVARPCTDVPCAEASPSSTQATPPRVHRHDSRQLTGGSSIRPQVGSRLWHDMMEAQRHSPSNAGGPDSGDRHSDGRPSKRARYM